MFLFGVISDTASVPVLPVPQAPAPSSADRRAPSRCCSVREAEQPPRAADASAPGPRPLPAGARGPGLRPPAMDPGERLHRYGRRARSLTPRQLFLLPIRSVVSVPLTDGETQPRSPTAGSPGSHIVIIKLFLTELPLCQPTPRPGLKPTTPQRAWSAAARRHRLLGRPRRCVGRGCSRPRRPANVVPSPSTFLKKLQINSGAQIGYSGNSSQATSDSVRHS